MIIDDTTEIKLCSARLTTMSLSDITWAKRKVGENTEIGTIYRLNFDTFFLDNQINPYTFIYKICKGGWLQVGDYEYKVREIPEDDVKVESKKSDTFNELSNLSYKTLHYGV